MFDTGVVADVAVFYRQKEQVFPLSKGPESNRSDLIQFEICFGLDVLDAGWWRMSLRSSASRRSLPV